MAVAQPPKSRRANCYVWVGFLLRLILRLDECDCHPNLFSLQLGTSFEEQDGPRVSDVRI